MAEDGDEDDEGDDRTTPQTESEVEPETTPEVDDAWETVPEGDDPDDASGDDAAGEETDDAGGDEPDGDPAPVAEPFEPGELPSDDTGEGASGEERSPDEGTDGTDEGTDGTDATTGAAEPASGEPTPGTGTGSPATDRAESGETGVAAVLSPSADVGERSTAGSAPSATEAAASATDPGDAVLRTEGLTKRFGELVAVDDVDLAVGRGEFRSVIGPNGAGKTTLFNLITGALALSEGAVYFDGEDVTGISPHERVRRGLGRSFQITNVFAGLTVRENVRLAAQAVRRKEISSIQRLVRSKDAFPAVNEATDDVLDRIGLAAHADDRASTLAYGDLRRLEIGLVLATDPKVVLLDEPTAGMSVDETRETMELIDEVLADRTLVLIEHDIDLVMNVSDRVTVLHRGSVLATGTPREVADDDSVQEAYLGGAGR